MISITKEDLKKGAKKTANHIKRNKAKYLAGALVAGSIASGKDPSRAVLKVARKSNKLKKVVEDD